MSRRDWFASVSKGVGGVCLLGGGVAGWRYLAPPAIRDLSEEVDLGQPGDIPAGAIHHVAAQHAFVIHDDDGYYALSGRCSHLGCRVFAQPDGFSCPCHGGKFDLRGAPIAGPPPRPLTWLRITRAADDRLVLHPRHAVAFGKMLRL